KRTVSSKVGPARATSGRARPISRTTAAARINAPLHRRRMGHLPGAGRYATIRRPVKGRPLLQRGTRVRRAAVDRLDDSAAAPDEEWSKAQENLARASVARHMPRPHDSLPGRDREWMVNRISWQSGLHVSHKVWYTPQR